MSGRAGRGKFRGHKTELHVMPPIESMTPIQKQIMKTRHPFEKNGMTNGKTLSALQKALTFCINQHNGWATENEIVDFLVENWSDITAISKQKFHQDPSLRLLHINTAIKKNGEFLFIKAEPNLVGINTYKGEPQDSDGESEQLHGENEDGLRLSEEEEEEGQDILKSRKWQFPPDALFQDIVLYVIHECDGVSFDDLLEFMKEYHDVPGNFRHLELRNRLRACLIDARISKMVRQKKNELWVSG